MAGLAYRPGLHGPPNLNNGQGQFGQAQFNFGNTDAPSLVTSLPFHGGPPPRDPASAVNGRFFVDPYRGTDEPFTDEWWGTVPGVVLTQPGMSEEAKHEKRTQEKNVDNRRLRKNIRKDCSRIRRFYDSEKMRFYEAVKQGDMKTIREINLKWYGVIKKYIHHYTCYGAKKCFLPKGQVAMVKWLFQKGKPHTEFNDKAMSYLMSLCPEDIRPEVVRVAYEDANQANNTAIKAARRARNKARNNSDNAVEGSDYHSDYDSDHGSGHDSDYGSDHGSDYDSDIDFGTNAGGNASEKCEMRVFQGNHAGKNTTQNMNTHASQNTNIHAGIDASKSPDMGVFANAGTRASESPDMNVPRTRDTEAFQKILAMAPWNQGTGTSETTDNYFNANASQNSSTTTFQNASSNSVTEAHTDDGMKPRKRARTDSGNDAGAHYGTSSYTSNRHNEYGNNNYGGNRPDSARRAVGYPGRARYGGNRRGGYQRGGYQYGGYRHGGYQGGSFQSGYLHDGAYQGGTPHGPADHGGYYNGGTYPGGAHHDGNHYDGYNQDGTHHAGDRQGQTYMRY